jgi:Mg-chelatase subunit ChlD
MLDLRLAWNRPARLPDGPTEHVLLIGLTPQAVLSRMSGSFCILMDCSGSMEGQKLEDANAACRLALDCLSGDDIWSLVAFNSSARIVAAGQSCRDITEGAVERHLSGLKAEGTTRLDLAISEARGALEANLGPDRVSAILLITDGHPTNARGNVIKDCSPFLGMVDDLSARGITLVTVGLGSACNYNSTFLTDLADRGRGRFCYAPDSSALAGILADEIRNAQRTVISDVRLGFRPLMRGSAVNSFCRIAPQFMPFDAASPDKEGISEYLCGSLQLQGTAAETVFLARVDVEGAFGLPPGPQQIMEVTPSWQAPDGSRVTGTAVVTSLNLTTIMREQQATDEEVERLRHMWDINIYQEMLKRTSDLNATGNLLQKIMNGARDAGRPDVAVQAEAQLTDLRKTGKLDPDSITRSSVNIRETGLL